MQFVATPSRDRIVTTCAFALVIAKKNALTVTFMWAALKVYIPLSYLIVQNIGGKAAP